MASRASPLLTVHDPTDSALLGVLSDLIGGYVHAVSHADRDLVLFVNGRSRSGANHAEEARSALINEGFNVTRFEVCSQKAKFTRLVHESVASKEPIIAIGGGDGTLRMAAELIAGSESALAVFPMGTGNAWAKDLGIPMGAAQAAKAMTTATTQLIDLGIANGHGFVNVATIGLTALIVKNLPGAGKSRFGKWVYLPAILRSLRELHAFELKVTSTHDNYEGHALLFVAAAGRTHAGPFRVTRASSNCDGKLSLYALDDTDRKGLFKFGVGLLTGMHTLLREVWTCEVESAKITTSPSKRIIVDGERTETTPLDLTIKPGALRVLVPGNP